MDAMIALTGVIHVYKIFAPGEGAANQATT